MTALSVARRGGHGSRLAAWLRVGDAGVRRILPFAKVVGAGTSASVAPQPQKRALRLLSIPGRDHENKYFAQLLGQVERRGLRIVWPKLGPLVRFRYDVLHLNFPTHQITENRAAKACLLSLLLAAYLVVARMLQRDIIYTVHDVTPLRVRHLMLLKGFVRLVHKLVTGYVFLSHSSHAAFVGQNPGQASKPWAMAPHGPYVVQLLTAEQRVIQRRLLACRADVFLVGFLGAIKPYKNVDALRQLPQRLADGRLVHVVVAGRVEAGHEELAARALASLPPEQLTVLQYRLSDTELNHLIQAVDVVLLPYARGSNSGAALLVLSNHGRLIGSELGMFRELADQLGNPWVYALDHQTASCRSYADLIRRAAEEQPRDADLLALGDFLAGIDWAVAAEAVEQLCIRLRSKPSFYRQFYGRMLKFRPRASTARSPAAIEPSVDPSG